MTIGKRISDRVYLTYARSLSSSERDEIILLEYDQSDRLGWVLSQNEDRTYALEVRKTASVLIGSMPYGRVAGGIVLRSRARRRRRPG